MLTPEQIEAIRPKLVTIQIIAAALIAGVFVFIGLISLVADWENLNQPLKMLSLMGALTGISMFGLSIIAPKIFASGIAADQASNPDQSSIIKTIINRLITENLIRYALIEAAVFLNLMVFLIEPHRSALVIAGIGVLMMLICYPRQSRMIAIIEDRLNAEA